jgi:spore maturation protein CgeB
VAFYDLDVPAHRAAAVQGRGSALDPDLVPRFDLFLTSTAGPMLGWLERQWGARCARPLYVSVDADRYRPDGGRTVWDLGYLGDRRSDLQAALESSLFEPARRDQRQRMVVAGAGFPARDWPASIDRLPLVLANRRMLYTALRFALCVTPPDLVEAGWSPDLHLFEAAACGTPVITDAWEGLDDVFEPGSEVLVSHGPCETLAFLEHLPERERLALGRRARRRVLREHMALHRARQLDGYVAQLAPRRSRSVARTRVESPFLGPVMPASQPAR